MNDYESKRSTVVLVTALMVLTAFAGMMAGPVGAHEAPSREVDSRADTESDNDDINGADALTSGVPNSASLLVSPADDYQDWFRIDCSRGQVLNVSLYHEDYNPADDGEYNLNLILYSPEEEGSLQYVPSWFSFLQTRWETATAVCAFSATYFARVMINVTGDDPPQIATEPVNYTIDATAQSPTTLDGGQSDQDTLSLDSSQWFKWYKVNTGPDQSFNARLTVPNGGNIDMDMFGLWNRGYDTQTYQGYQPFFLNQTRNDNSNQNIEQMGGMTGDMDIYIRLWAREGTGLGQYTFQLQNSMVSSDNNNIPDDAVLVEKSTSYSVHAHQSMDHFDWYKFTIDAGFTVDLTFLPLIVRTSYWNVTIWDDNLDYVEGWFNTQDGHPFEPQTQQDPGNPISSGGINKQDWDPPSPGTYYIMVMPIAQDPQAHMREPPLVDQDYRLFIGLPNFGPENQSQIQDVEIDEDSEFTGLDLADYFRDPEGDPLSYSASDDSNKVTTVLEGSNLSATPAADWFGECNITVEATDGSANIGANTIEQTFKLTVESVNDDPFVKQIFTNFTMFEGDEDKQTPPYQLSKVFDDIDSDLDYSYSGNNKIQVRIDHQTTDVYFSSPDLWFGEENITFTAQDEGTNVAKVTVNVRVNHRNHKPTLSFGKDTYEMEMEEDDDANTELNVADMFEDIDTTYAGDTLNYRLKEPLPLHLTVEIMEDNTLSVTPDANWSGDAQFKVLVEDSFGATNETTIIVTVEAVNDPPSITVVQPSGEEVTMNEGDFENFMVSSVQDIDNDTKYDIRYKWYVDNELQTDDNVKNHQFTFRTVHLEEDGFDEGTYHIKVIATDGMLEDEREWTVTVKDVNLPPEGARIVSPTTDVKYKVGKEILFEADANATDPDGDSLEYEWVERTSNTTLSTERTFTFDWKDKELKKVLKPGKHTIDLIISDGRGEEIKTSVTITIKEKSGEESPGFEGLILVASLVLVALVAWRRRSGTQKK